MSTPCRGCQSDTPTAAIDCYLWLRARLVKPWLDIFSGRRRQMARPETAWTAGGWTGVPLRPLGGPMTGLVTVEDSRMACKGPVIRQPL